MRQYGPFVWEGAWARGCEGRPGALASQPGVGLDPGAATVPHMALDPVVLADLKQTKAGIDELQQRLKDLVAQLRQQGATAQEIADALRG
jgi:hypothetical protein